MNAGNHFTLRILFHVRPIHPSIVYAAKWVGTYLGHVWIAETRASWWRNWRSCGWYCVVLRQKVTLRFYCTLVALLLHEQDLCSFNKLLW